MMRLGRDRPWPCASAMTAAAPDPWIIRKYMVIVVLCLSVWAFYVGVGRVCYPAIRHHADSGYTRAAGIGILVGFVILWLMCMWSYIAVITTPPGYARDVVPTTPNPARTAPAPSGPAPFFPLDELPESATSGSTPPSPSDQGVVHQNGVPPPSVAGQGGGIQETNLYQNAVPPPPPQTESTIHHQNGTPVPLRPLGPESYQNGNPRPLESESTLPLCPPLAGPSKPDTSAKPNTPRVPRPVPPVSPYPRWCQYCEIVKPDRTHHCRHCGTCILQFDHHCVWLGQCVGWRNHAIFVSFNLWGGLFCIFNMLILILDMAISGNIDPQKIVLVAICAILGLFTLFMMLPSHIHLILAGRTTLESFQTGTQQRAESAALQHAFNSHCPVGDIRRTRKQWEREYGGVKVNDRWAFGRKRDMWRQEMGRNIVGWILPVGRPLGDGINFSANPRFGPNGEWLRMEDWPKVVAIKA